MTCVVKVVLPKDGLAYSPHPPSTPLSVVRKFIRSYHFGAPFSLATSDMSRVFTEEEDTITLEEAGLCPTGTLILLPEKILVENIDNPRLVQVTSNEHYDELKATPEILVIVLFVSKFCHFCKDMVKELDNVSKSNTGLLVLCVDVDELETLPDRQGVEHLPSYKYFKNGELLTSFYGSKKETVHKNIEKYL